MNFGRNLLNFEFWNEIYRKIPKFRIPVTSGNEKKTEISAKFRRKVKPWSGVRSGRRATTPVRPDSQSPFPLVRPRHQTLKSSRKSSEDPNEFRCTYISISQTAYLVTKLDLPIRQEEKGTKVYPSTEDYVILNVYFFEITQHSSDRMISTKCSCDCIHYLDHY